jgi:hypothetical protein
MSRGNKVCHPINEVSEAHLLTVRYSSSFFWKSHDLEIIKVCSPVTIAKNSDISSRFLLVFKLAGVGFMPITLRYSLASIFFFLGDDKAFYSVTSSTAEFYLNLFSSLIQIAFASFNASKGWLESYHDVR